MFHEGGGVDIAREGSPEGGRHLQLVHLCVVTHLLPEHLDELMVLVSLAQGITLRIKLLGDVWILENEFRDQFVYAGFDGFIPEVLFVDGEFQHDVLEK